MLSYNSITKNGKGTPFITALIMVNMNIPDWVKFKEYRFDCSNEERSLNQLKNVVCNADKRVSSDHLASIFKLSPGTVRAWRAHHTMGRYTFNEPPAVTIYVPGEKLGSDDAVSIYKQNEDLKEHKDRTWTVEDYLRLREITDARGY